MMKESNGGNIFDVPFVTTKDTIGGNLFDVSFRTAQIIDPGVRSFEKMRRSQSGTSFVSLPSMECIEMGAPS